MNKTSSFTKQNKRITLIAVLAVVIALCFVFAVSCEYINPALVRITAVYNGGDVEVGGTLNKSDIVVVAYFSDKKSKVVTEYGLIYDFSTVGQSKVEVGYGYHGKEETCSFYVNVVEKNVDPELPTPPNPPTPPVPAVILENITAVYNGESIKVGGTLNNEDIVVTAYYSDETSKPVTNFSVGGFSSSTAGTQTVNVSYTEGEIVKECTVNITVIENVVEVADYGKYGILQGDGSIKITNTAVVNDDLQIHFLAFENVTSGDSIYIKAGDKDVLIDAGSTESSASTIDKYIQKYCTDGVLEYVIATHAHSDHISGFVGSFSSDGTDKKNGILDLYDCDTIITYANKSTSSKLSQRFESKCQTQKDDGANVYTALECYNNQNGASRVYKLTENIELEILYNYYYDHPLKSDENSHSVCLMINQYGNGYDFDNPNNPDNENYVNHFLFTGDLEENGESYLVDKNTLPKVTLFKAGHHGSATASTSKLLQVIQPKLVCVCTCCDDANTYKFPRQEFIDRVAVYTDMVFMTNTRNGTSTLYVHLNGNIAVTSNGNGVFVNCSNNNTLFKDTDWFKNNRTCPPEWESLATSG